MQDIWRRIEAKLKTEAREALARLRPGASEQAIAKLEATLGCPLPPDYRASALVHDGGDMFSIAPWYELLSLEEVSEQWSVWRDLVQDGTFEGEESEPDGPIKTDWWNLGWVPITHNGGGDHQCLDLDPAKGGQVGQVIDFGHEEGATAIVAANFRAMLEEFATRLEAGEIAFDEAGLVIDEMDE